MSEPMHVTDAAFEETVLKSATPVIVDFWAPWCGPCRQVAPSLEKIAADYDGKVVVAKVNTDENSEWAQQYEVSGIPTMLFVAGGKIVYRQVGAVPFGYLKNIVDKFLDVVNTPAAAELLATAEAAAQPVAPATEPAPGAQS
jgi:thioredoxin 1